MDQLLGLTEDRPLRSLEAGEVVIRQGGDPGPMFVLVEGRIVVERDGERIAGVDIPGAVFGEMAAVLGQPSSATVRAEISTRVRVVDEPVAFMLERPEAALAVLRTVGKRLDNMLVYLTDVRQQYADQGGHLSMLGDVLSALSTQQVRDIRTGSAREPDPDY